MILSIILTIILVLIILVLVCVISGLEELYEEFYEKSIHESKLISANLEILDSVDKFVGKVYKEDTTKQYPLEAVNIEHISTDDINDLVNELLGIVHANNINQIFRK